MGLLDSMSTKKGLVFPSRRKGNPLSQQAMNQCLDGIRTDGASVHGMRISFSTWAREQTQFSHDVIEAALAHGHGSKVVAAYARTSYLPQRVELMQAWADYRFSAAS